MSARNQQKHRGPSFKDQVRAGVAAPPTAPLAEAMPVSAAVVEGEQEQQERLLALEARLGAVERQAAAEQNHSPEPSSFPKKYWKCLVGLTVLVVVVASSVSLVLTRNASSDTTNNASTNDAVDVNLTTSGPSSPPGMFLPTPVPSATSLVTSVSPTLGPTDRATSIRTLINSVTLTNRTLVYPSQETPEEQALQWLIEEDVGTQDVLAQQQRYALATLWFGNGPFTASPFDSNPAPPSDTWITSMEECDWQRVDCVGGEMRGLRLAFSSASGVIPPDLGLLTQLTWLTLDRNQLTGSIPIQLGLLTALETLGLAGDVNEFPSNQLTGSIPSQIGALTQLTQLALDNNRLSSSIPSQMGMLTQLTSLSLHQNQLSGTIPSEIVSLTSLMYLYVNTNSITGTMPFCDIDFFGQLRLLRADCEKIECPCCTSCL